MPADPEQCAEILDRLAPLGDVTSRRMFGGMAFWEAGDVFAYVDGDGTLHFKADATTEADFVAAGSSRFGADRNVNMPYWSVPDDVLADDDRFDEWARRAIAVGHANPTAKKRRRRPGPPVLARPPKGRARTP
jgi:DNA transformation protein and related proteins